jgi:hypothetical protein
MTTTTMPSSVDKSQISAARDQCSESGSCSALEDVARRLPFRLSRVQLEIEVEQLLQKVADRAVTTRAARQ